MEIQVEPEPSEAERAALLEALEAPAEAPSAYGSEWRRAALTEATETDEP
jgi:hypothetical protein